MEHTSIPYDNSSYQSRLRVSTQSTFNIRKSMILLML